MPNNNNKILLASALVFVAACSDGTNTQSASYSVFSHRAFNDTGIDKCLDDKGGFIDCQVAPDGQDGNSGLDVADAVDNDGRLGFRFTKLDATGQPLSNQSLSYQNQAWSCVQDENTGYMWEVKTDDGGIRDKNWSYSWYQPDDAINMGNPGTANLGECHAPDSGAPSCDTEAYIKLLNKIKLCGYDDWRLPNLIELLSIRDYGAAPGTTAIDKRFFPNALAYSVWSDVSADAGSNNAFAVEFRVADEVSVTYPGVVKIDKASATSTSVATGVTTYAPRIRAVRGGERYTSSELPLCLEGTSAIAPVYQQSPDSRFYITRNEFNESDGTATDNLTHLMWKRCSEGQVFNPNSDTCDGEPSVTITSLKLALDNARQSSFADYNDWRVPNIKELNSLVEPICHYKVINQRIFPNTPPNDYWTSSINVDETQVDHVLYMSFATGENYSDGFFDFNGNGHLNLRLVRDVD